MCCINDDFDNDGFLDVVETSFDPCQPMHAFRNNGDGTFADVSKRSQLTEIAQTKMKDLNANDIESATKIIEGSARAMGLQVVEG